MLELRLSNPMRPVDWRWQRVCLLRDSQCHASVKIDDRLTVKALKFARQLLNCQAEGDYLRLLDAHTDLYEAHGIYKEAAYQNFRFEIEARIMANEPVAEIARKLGVSPAIISMFEACFFDVRSRLDAQSYIQQRVFQPAAVAGLKNREYDLLWKMYGYWGGPILLDAMIYGTNQPAKPDSAAGVAAFWQDDIADQVRQKAAVAMRKMPVDSQTQQEIVNTYQKMLELERTAGEGKGANEAMLTNINAMLGELPWRKYQRTETALTEADKFDTAGVNLRSMQLIAAGSGGVPADLHAVLMSAKFPAEPPSRMPG